MLPFPGASPPPTSSRSLAATDPVIVQYYYYLPNLYMELHVAVLASSLTARWRL